METCLFSTPHHNIMCDIYDIYIYLTVQTVVHTTITPHRDDEMRYLQFIADMTQEIVSTGLTSDRYTIPSQFV